MKRLITTVLLIMVATISFATMPVTTIAPMLKKVMPAVVNVRVDGEILLPASALPGAPNQRTRNPMPQTRKIQQLGSGVIMDAKKGYIITNAHVVQHEKLITVTLSDSRHFTAKLIGKDTASDIAVLQIKASHLTSLVIGDSDKIEVGDFVAAIGSPFGLNKTATAGIVSALQRNDLNIEGLENFIQTDAAINPGNSGGALVTFNGKLIGINTAIIAPAGGNVGIGFSIPINMAKSVMEQIIKYGEVRRGLLGIFAQPLTPDLAEALGLSDNVKGTVITSISPDSAADKAGLKVGDVVVSINGVMVNSPFQVRNIIGLVRIGSRVKISILRKGKTLVKHAHITGSAYQAKQMQKQQPFLNGISFSDVNKIQSTAHGVINGGIQVLTVSPSSPAETAGLIPGDIIISANQVPVKNIAQLFQAAKKQKHSLLLNVIRGPGALYIVIK